jgi:Lipocalin-like domain
MSKFKIVGMMALIAFAMGIVLVGDALAQQKTLKEQLVGTWTLVSNNNVAPDGTRLQLFGPNPKGIVIYDANGLRGSGKDRWWI